MNLHGIVRELIEHSTLNGSHKAFLRWHVDNEDPTATPEGPEPVTATAETPEQELARLRAENDALKAEPVSRETTPPAAVFTPPAKGGS